MSPLPTRWLKSRGALAALSLGGAVALALLGGPRLRGLMGNTAWLAGGTMAIAIPLGALWGLVIAKIDVPGRGLLRWLTVGMMLTPLAVHASAWQAALGTGGWLTQALADGPYAPAWLAGWRGAIWVHAMAAVPWVAAFTWVSLATVERPYEEQSLLDAPPWRVLRRVSLPRGASGLVASALWIVVVCGTEIAVTDLFLTGVGQNTFAEEVYVAASLGALSGADLPPVNADGALRAVGRLAATDLVVGTLLLGLAATAAILIIARHLPAALAVDPARRWVWRPERGRGGWVLLVCLTAAMVAAVPLAGLVWKVGMTTTATAAGPERAWSAADAAWRVVASPWEHRREWGWTWLIALPAAAMAMGVAVHGAWLVRARRRVVPLAAVAVGLLAAVPGPLGAVVVIGLLNRPPESAWAWLTTLYDRTLVAPILVQMLRVVPWAAVVVWSLLERVPQDLIDNARCDGMGFWRQLWQLAVPLQWGGMAAVGGLVAALAAGELSATLLVTPPGVTPLPTRLFGLLHYGMDERAAAISLSSLAVAGLLTLVIAPLVGRGRRA